MNSPTSLPTPGNGSAPGKAPGAQARAKLLLFGEHAAVYGFPALGLALPWSLEVQARSRDGQESRSRFPGLEKDLARAANQIFEQIVPREARELRQWTWDIRSQIPLASGFGSSGAFCAALVRLAYPDDSFQAQWQRANEAEALFHGTPSGIDTGLCLSQGLALLEPRRAVCACDQWPPLTFPADDGSGLPLLSTLPNRPLVLLVGSLHRGQNSTRELVARIREKVQAGDPLVRQRLEQLGRYSREAAQIIQSQDNPALALGPLATRAQEGLAALGLSTTLMDRLLEQGLRAGALGGKLSGAGGGGAFYLLFPPTTEGRQKAHQMEQNWAADKALAGQFSMLPRSLDWGTSPTGADNLKTLSRKQP